MAKVWTPKISNASEDVEKQELSLVHGNEKWYRHTQRQFGISYKSKHPLTKRSNDMTLWYLLKVVEKLCQQNKLCTQRFIVALFVIDKTWK